MNTSPQTLHIEHSCPQCGAPVTLGEADRLFQCAFCRNRLLLQTTDVFHYRLPVSEGINTDLVYLPYWRLKGSAFAIQGTEISSRFVDANALALVLPGYPPTLGLRPQAMTLRFVSPDSPGKFIAPQKTRQEILPQGGTSVFPFPHPSAPLYIGETASLIYAPVHWKNGRPHDAVLDRPLPGPSGQENPADLPEASPWQVRFLPALCPECGWDLEGERDAQVFLCRNCHSGWNCEKETLGKVPVSFLRENQKNVIYLPFWKLRIRLEGITLNTFADLIRLGNLPKVAGREDEQPLWFWTPAFKIHPSLFLRWARQATVYQSREETVAALPDMPIKSASLHLTEAREMIRILLADIVADKRRLLPLLPTLSIVPMAHEVAYHPFLIRHQELIHTRMGVTLDRRALGFGAHL